MTEQEARSKWCPMVRNNWHGTSTNRGDRGSIETCSCIASDCMMWRWNRKLTDVNSEEKFTEGYCGLGGKP